MAHDVAYHLSQSVADFARWAATLNAQLETLQERIAAVTAELDAVKVELAKAKGE